MIKLNNLDIILDVSELNSKIPYVNFDLKSSYNKLNTALKIDFKNDFNYSIKCIKKLISFQKNNIFFSTSYNGYNLKFIICNYSKDVIIALKALFINNIKERYIFLYNALVNELDFLWKSNNPCRFCNNICIASKNKATSHLENGCCYSFEYSKSLFNFIDNIQLCKYLGDDKKCKTQNLSCKLFVCKYLKNNKLFNINMNKFLIIKTFFNNKQKLILKYNFFKSKEEIIAKLLETDSTPFLLYYLENKYHIN